MLPRRGRRRRHRAATAGRRGSQQESTRRGFSRRARCPTCNSRRVGQWPDRLSYKEDAGGSTPPSSTVAEVEVDDTPGRGPGRSRFESGRSPHHHQCGGSGDQWGLIRPARGFDPRPRHQPPEHQGRWRNWKRDSLARRRVRVRLPLGPPTNADVAQPGEARRSDRRQCRFESDRQYAPAHVAQPGEARGREPRQCGFDSRREYRLGVAQRERTGFGSRGLEVRALPSRPAAWRTQSLRGGGTGTTPGSEPGGPRSNRGLAAIDASAVVAP